MTDLALSEEQEALRGSARTLLQREWPPELARRALAAGGDGHDADLWRRMCELGWVGLAFPNDVGGGGGGLLDLAVVYEEAGRALVPTSLYSTVEAALLIERAGDDAQRTGLLRPVLAGDRIVSVAYHEDGVRASADALATTSVLEGDAVVVNGTKLFVPNAGVADDLVVVARDPVAAGAGGVRLVVVPTGAPGVRRSRMGTFAHDAQHEVALEAVRVPPDRVLAAGLPDAWSTVEGVRRVATALQCVEMVGGARAVLDMTVGYVGDRSQFGRPIGSFQAVQHHVADLSTRIDAAGLAAWWAVWRCSVDGGRDDAIGGAQAAVAIAKVAAGDAYVEATLIAHQLHGGIGFTLEHDLHLWSDRARAATLTHGSREDHLRALGTLVARAR
ncbi:MAG TPA: acyl-CoA dehydrogenase [Acidimicrobiales bacterium]|nr:acyl-CoA dehydrogenase [Acidimicrobiales bacterium]